MNRALEKFLAWTKESDLEVVVWKTEYGDIPAMLSVVDAETGDAFSLHVTDGEAGQPEATS